jgi:hypothetical protein
MFYISEVCGETVVILFLFEIQTLAPPFLKNKNRPHTKRFVSIVEKPIHERETVSYGLVTPFGQETVSRRHRKNTLN